MRVRKSLSPRALVGLISLLTLCAASDQKPAFAAKEIWFCSRHYAEIDESGESHFKFLAIEEPCCEGEPLWDDCRWQGRTPVQTSRACEFTTGAQKQKHGYVWVCPLEDHKRAKLTQNKNTNPDSLEALDWLNHLGAPKVPDTRASHDCPTAPAKKHLSPRIATRGKLPQSSVVASSKALPPAPLVEVSPPAPSVEESPNVPVIEVSPPAPVVEISPPTPPSEEVPPAPKKAEFPQNTFTVHDNTSDSVFLNRAMRFQTPVAGVFARYLNGLKKLNNNHSALLWYGTLGTQTKLPDGIEDLFAKAKADASVVELGLDGYASGNHPGQPAGPVSGSTLAQLQDCPSQSHSTAICKQLLQWKALFLKYPDTPVYLRLFSEMNLDLHVTWGKLQFAKTWNRIVEILRGGNQPLNNVKLIFSPMASLEKNRDSPSGFSNMREILEKIDPRYIDAFGLNLYGRSIGRIRPTDRSMMEKNPPSFQSIIGPWMNMFAEVNHYYGETKPVTLPEMAISRLPFPSAVVNDIYVLPGIRSAGVTLKEAVPLIVAAIHHSQVDHGADKASLVKQMKDYMMSSGDPSDARYIDLTVRALTPGDPLYEDWDRKRAQWIEEAYAYAKRYHFPLSVYFKENGQDWDAEPGSRAEKALRESIARYQNAN